MTVIIHHLALLEDKPSLIAHCGVLASDTDPVHTADVLRAFSALDEVHVDICPTCFAVVLDRSLAPHWAWDATRKELGITDAELAEELDWDPQRVADVLHDRDMYDRATDTALIIALGRVAARKGASGEPAADGPAR